MLPRRVDCAFVIGQRREFRAQLRRDLKGGLSWRGGGESQRQGPKSERMHGYNLPERRRLENPRFLSELGSTYIESDYVLARWHGCARLSAPAATTAATAAAAKSTTTFRRHAVDSCLLRALQRPDHLAGRVCHCYCHRLWRVLLQVVIDKQAVRLIGRTLKSIAAAAFIALRCVAADRFRVHCEEINALQVFLGQLADGSNIHHPNAAAVSAGD